MTEMALDLDNWFDEATATFGDRMAAAREQAGLSPQQLAKHLGVKLTTIRNWEQDLSEPRANKLQMMAGLLGVSLTWLLTGEGEGLDAPGEEGALSADVLDILSDIRSIKSELKGTADRLARLEKALRAKLKEV